MNVETEKQTLEEIYYDIDEVHGEQGYAGTNSLRDIIAKTLALLPNEAYETVMQGDRPIHFFGLGAYQLAAATRWHQAFPPSATIGKMEHEIVILSGALCTMDPKDAIWIVAHELAHVYLNHTATHAVPEGDRKIMPNHEKQADDLATEWLGYRADRTTWEKK
jgi:hypothetical protein